VQRRDSLTGLRHRAACVGTSADAARTSACATFTDTARFCGGPCVGLDQPGRRVGNTQSAFDSRVTEVGSPNYVRPVDIGGVVDPLVEHVLRAVAHEYQVLAGQRRQLVIDAECGPRRPVIDEVGGVERPRRAAWSDSRTTCRTRTGNGPSASETTSRAAARPAASGLEILARHARQHEHTRQRGDVVRIKVRIEVVRRSANSRMAPASPQQPPAARHRRQKGRQPPSAVEKKEAVKVQPLSSRAT